MDAVLDPLEGATKVRHDGFTVQPRALTARQVEQCRAACAAAPAGYCIQPQPGHYDVVVPQFSDARFGFLHAGAPWMSTTRVLLGDDCALVAAGMLDADAGAAAGEARHSTSHLLEQPLIDAAAAAPHCITIYIPLMDSDGEANGTALWPRSHHGDGWRPPAAVTAAPDSARDDDDTTTAVSPVLRAGDALLFDSRLLQKALANRTRTRQPMLYLILARPWFREVHHRAGKTPPCAVSRFARVPLAAEHVPVAVGSAVHLFLRGAWARAVVLSVRRATEVHAGTPRRRSVRMGRVLMDETGEEKEGDIDELLLKGHFILELTEEVEEPVQGEGAGEREEEQVEGEELGEEQEAASSSDSESSDESSLDESCASDDPSHASGNVAVSIADEAVAPLCVSRLRRACASEFRVEGFTIAAGALTPAEVAQTRAACEEARANAREAHRLHLAPGRLDLLMPAFATPPFRFLHARAPWVEAARSLLGDDCSLFTGGVLFNEPGAGAGNVHLDGDHLLEAPPPGTAAPPPHCLTVFIPLIDVDGEMNGTALWPRSHHGDGWAPTEAGAHRSTETAATAATHRGNAVAPALRAGDALLFDFRLLHRALANGIGVVRPMIYLILSRRWFRDCDNWPDMEVSLAFERVNLSAEAAAATPPPQSCSLRPETDAPAASGEDAPAVLVGDELAASVTVELAASFEEELAVSLGDDGASVQVELIDELMVECKDCSRAGPALFDRFGVFAIRDAVPLATLAELQRAATANLDEVLRYRALHYAAGTMGNGTWRELCCRDGDRFDVHFRMAEEPFATLGRGGGCWCEAVRRILGPDAKLLYTGQIVACGCDPEPDSDEEEAGDQAWHMDGKHMDDHLQLPCHTLTVLVPLVDVNADNGATEFSLGTHMHECEDLGERLIECKAGSAIVFDYRLLHRGTANRTTVDRPILYFTYARAGVEDLVNYRHENQQVSILHGLSGAC